MKPIADALELLTAQHDDIAAVLETIPSLDPRELAHALGELADHVATHLAAEEQFLSMLGIRTPADEHDALREALADILATDTTSSALGDRIAAFTAQWTSHATAQEHTMFIALAETLEPSVLADIGLQLGAWSEQSRCLAA